MTSRKIRKGGIEFKSFIWPQIYGQQASSDLDFSAPKVWFTVIGFGCLLFLKTQRICILSDKGTIFLQN